MEWVQTLTIIGVNVTLFAALTTLIIWIVNKLDNDVRGCLARMDKTDIKMDAKFESHSARIDQLYRMFVELLKEKK